MGGSMTVYQAIVKAQSMYSTLSENACIDSMAEITGHSEQVKSIVREMRIEAAITEARVAQALSIMLDNMPVYVAEMEV
jgi:hypothetical protein